VAGLTGAARLAAGFFLAAAFVAGAAFLRATGLIFFFAAGRRAGLAFRTTDLFFFAAGFFQRVSSRRFFSSLVGVSSL
jgi:hypothetical protein